MAGSPQKKPRTSQVALVMVAVSKVAELAQWRTRIWLAIRLCLGLLVPLPPSRALPKLFPHLSVHADATPMLGFSFSLLRCEGRTERRAKWNKTLRPAFRNHLTSLGRTVFRISGQIVLMEFVLKNTCQQLCIF